MGKGIRTPTGEVVHLRTSFTVQDKIEAFYTGGDVVLSADGQHLFCACGSAVKILCVATGRVEHSVEEEEDMVTAFSLSPDSEHLVVAWRSLLLRQYNWTNEKCTRSWKGHLGPVLSMAFDPTSTLLATGSSDSSIKVWDCKKQFCTHNFRGSNGMVTLLQFHSDPDALRLFSSAIDCAIRVWDLRTSRCIHVLEGHVSAVTCLGFAGETLLSGGRDKVIHVWDNSTGALKKTFPVFEAVESLVVVPKGLVVVPGELAGEAEVMFATAGDKGVIRLWDASTGQNLHSLQPLTGLTITETPGGSSENPPEGGYTGLLLCSQLGALAGVTYDHNIIFYSLKEPEVLKQFIGYPDEILDMRFIGEGEGHLAVATNSEQVKVFEQSTLSCQLLSGHSGIILCLDSSSPPGGQLLGTSSKDRSIRVWRMGEGARFHCVAIGIGHTHSVGAIALSRLKGSFAVSGSQDCTMKLWSLKSTDKWQEGDQPVRLPVKYTQLAHNKDINSVDVSPNDKLLVSGSQDKTAKLWQVSDGSLLGVFRGHRRGVWSVKFSPVDQCVATSSGDATVKLWAVADFSCVKTFEGHTNSVLKAVFLTRGMQIASSGSDGLIKIWTIKTNECVATLDQHTEKVWSLTPASDGCLLASGGADSLLCLWKDVTEQVETEARVEKEQLILREQELSNLLQSRDFVRAVGVAITLDQPVRVLSILSELLDEGGVEGSFSETILALREDQMHAILKYLNKWNMNAKHSRVAQTVLSLVLKHYSPETLMQVEDIRQTLEGLIPYTERHFQRLSRLQQLSTFVDYTWQCMRLPGDEPSEKVAPASAVTQDDARTRPGLAEIVPVTAPADSTTPGMVGLFVEDRLPEAGLHYHDNSEDHVSHSEDHVTSTNDREVAQEEEPKKTKLRNKARRSLRQRATITSRHQVESYISYFIL